MNHLKLDTLLGWLLWGIYIKWIKPNMHLCFMQLRPLPFLLPYFMSAINMTQMSVYGSLNYYAQIVTTISLCKFNVYWKKKKYSHLRLNKFATNVINQWTTLHHIVHLANKKKIYEHRVECTLETIKGTIKCNVCYLRLKECCQAIIEIPYENYSKRISSTMFHLWKLCHQGFFTLTIDSSIIEIKKLWLPQNKL